MPDPIIDPPPAADPPKADETFTQADIDKIVGKTRTEERRKVLEKFADYDDLKTRAEGTQTLEARIADMETKAGQSEQRALRAEIAGEFGISTKRGPKDEPSDADLLLTGADEAAMRAQAARLADGEAERKRKGNHVPREGDNPKAGDDPMRDLTRTLFRTGD